MPWHTLTLTPNEAIKTASSMLTILIDDISRVTERGDARLNGMSYTKKLRGIRQTLIDVQTQLDREPIPLLIANQKFEFETYTSGRKRGPSRPEILSTTTSILLSLRKIGTPQCLLFIADIDRLLADLTTIKFPTPRKKQE